MVEKAVTNNDKLAKYMFRRGVQAGLPIVLGYFPIAVTYGVLAAQSGISLIDLTLMSVLVFAGASQFMAANMIAVGTSAIEIIVATFVLNFRMSVLNLSFMNIVRDAIPLKSRVALSFLLTDESFAVSIAHKDEAKKKKAFLFFLGIHLAAYVSWLSGSFVGGLLGEIIPEQISQSMGVALYALFIGLLVPAVKKELRVALVAVIAMLINVIFSQFVSSGWAIVLGTVLGGLSGVFILKDDTT